MDGKLNGVRLRLCAVVWELREMELIGQRDADAMLERIETMTWRETAEFARALLKLDRQKAAS